MKRTRQAFIKHIGKSTLLFFFDLPNMNNDTDFMNYSNGIIELYDDIVSRRVCIQDRISY